MTTDTAPTLSPPPLVIPEALKPKNEPKFWPKVMIALCTRDWQSEAHTTESVRMIGKQYPGEIEVRYMMNDGVARARNNLAADFLTSDCHVLHFLDNDIICEYRHFERIVTTAWERGIIGGLYPKKQPVLEWVVNWLPNEQPDDEGRVKVKHMGTGFLSISRPMLEDYVKKHPEIEYRHDPHPEAVRWDLFPMRAIGGQYKSEDWAFCEMAREAGWDVWADTKVQLRHIGKCVYPLQFTLSDDDIVDLLVHRYEIYPDAVRTFIASGRKAPGLMGGHRERPVRHWPKDYPVSDLYGSEVLQGCFDIPLYVENGGEGVTIVDIGADVGSFARWCQKRWPKAQLHCYETRPEFINSLVVTCNRVADKGSPKPVVYAGELTAESVGGIPQAGIYKIDMLGKERDLLEALHGMGRLTAADAVIVRYGDRSTVLWMAMMLGQTHVEHVNQGYADGGGVIKYVRRAEK